ncbi:MAG: riboflavin synthase [Dehalococcoidales bacterium]|nr:riboflavin synthase [Dehalococcoidales bacterium]
MFTGIIEEVGKVVTASPDKLTVNASKVLQETEPGASIAVNGVCLTVTNLTRNSFTVDVMEETLRRSNLGRLTSGAKVNLERAMALGGRMGGHLVQGHIDGTGKVISIKPENGAALVKIEAPPAIMHYVVEKGFIAVDGISLTVTGKDTGSFGVSIVNFTQQNTILADVKIGIIVNLEIDIIAKYVEQLTKPHSGNISMDFLREHGFTV